MSFNKKYLNEPSEIAKSIEHNPDKAFRSYSKSDAFIGSQQSMNLVHEFMEAYDEDPKQDFTTITRKYTT